MSKNKTTEASLSVEDIINVVKCETKRNDCFSFIKVIKKQIRLGPKMRGPSIMGFSIHHYKYESGREGNSPNVAFSPRAASIAIYLSGNFKYRGTLLEKLDKHKADKGCIYIKTLTDIDKDILSNMIANHIKHINELYGGN